MNKGELIRFLSSFVDEIELFVDVEGTVMPIQDITYAMRPDKKGSVVLIAEEIKGRS